MNEDVDWEYFRAVEVNETDKARLVRLVSGDGEEHWVPKSVSDWHQLPTAGQPGTVVIEKWWCHSNGVAGRRAL